MNTRIAKIRLYLFDVLDTLLGTNDYEINASFIDSGNFSVNRVPIDKNPTNWIIPVTRHREVYELTSSRPYTPDVVNNLKNIGFFEDFEQTIYSNNEKGILPDIEGIESIECLNAGALALAETPESIFSIQIEIQYIEDRQKTEDRQNSL